MSIRVTKVSKQIEFATSNHLRVTSIFKQVVFTDTTMPVPPSPAAPVPAAPGVKRAVLYICEATGSRIIAVGVGIDQVGDDYQAEIETHDWLPAGESGSVYFRTVPIALNAIGAHSIGVIPIVDGNELPEQQFSGAGTGEVVYPVYVNARGTRLRLRIRTITRGGPIEFENLDAVFVPVRPFPQSPAPSL